MASDASTCRVSRRRGRCVAVGLALCALVTLSARPASASGGCVDVGCLFEGYEALPLYLLIATGMVVGIGADVYYTPKVLGNSFDGRGPSPDTARNEIYWTGWQSAIFFVGTAYGAAANPGALGLLDGAEGARSWLALLTWPYAITSHGIWYSTDDPLARYPVPGVLGMTDALLLTYDIAGIATGRRYSAVFPVVEILMGGLQTTYGLGWATHQRGQERTRTLALTSVPALLALHGVASLIIGPPDESAEIVSDVSPGDPLEVRATPMVVARPGGAELVFTGVW